MMGFPWKKILQVGALVGAAVGGPAGRIAGAIVSGADAVESNLPDLKGPQKKEAALKLAQGIVEAIEEGADRDLLNDAEVAKAVGEVNDAYVALRNAEAHLRAAVAAAKAAKAA